MVSFCFDILCFHSYFKKCFDLLSNLFNDPWSFTNLLFTFQVFISFKLLFLLLISSFVSLWLEMISCMTCDIWYIYMHMCASDIWHLIEYTIESLSGIPYCKDFFHSFRFIFVWSDYFRVLTRVESCFLFLAYTAFKTLNCICLFVCFIEDLIFFKISILLFRVCSYSLTNILIPVNHWFPHLSICTLLQNIMGSLCQALRTVFQWAA